MLKLAYNRENISGNLNMKKNRPSIYIMPVLVIGIFTLLSLKNDEMKPVLMDGKFEEWTSSLLVHSDRLNDNVFGNIDFGKLWIAHTADFLFFNIEVGAEINLQEKNDIVLLLDMDNDNATGIQRNGLGVEFSYAFGSRDGKMLDENGKLHKINHADIGLVTAPTVTSTRFEIALNRNKTVNLFRSDTIQVRFIHDGPGGDLLPDMGLPPVTYICTETDGVLPASYSLDRHPDAGIRVVSYNMLRTGLFDPERANTFARIFKALNADIIGMQEMYKASASETLTKLMALAALDDGYTWYSDKQGPENIVLSRFPIKHSKEIEGGNGAFLVALPSQYNIDLLVINVHTPCCGDNKGRQYEIDALMAFIRDLKRGRGPFPFAENTPIIILGDLNLVGYAQQLETLLTGDIVNKKFGPSFSPDWDGSAFTDLAPTIPSSPFTFTWYSETSSFSPGRLDVMIFSDYVLEPLRSFVSFTPYLSADQLNAYGLKSSDVTTVSDHLPVVCDFKILTK